MTRCIYLFFLLSIVGLTGCKTTQEQSHWAGQNLLHGWHDQIKGTKIPTGYRSPAGTFELTFPISNNHIFIRDFVDTGEKQPYEVRVREVAHFRDPYGYNTKILTMVAAECPDMQALEYEWVARKLPDIVSRTPGTDKMRQHEKYGPWRVFTFGPYESSRGFIIYRIEAFFRFQDMVFRVISYNNIISDQMREATGISQDKTEQMAIASTTKHFDQFIKNLVLIGRQVQAEPEDKNHEPQPTPETQEPQEQTDPDLLAMSL